MFRKLKWMRFRPARHAITDGNPFEVAMHRLERVLPRHPRVDRLERYIKLFNQTVARGGDVGDKLALLYVMAPRTVLAQLEMDRHRHGYHNKSARLYELIDFNDAFVDAILSLNPTYYPLFSTRVKAACDELCRRANTPAFSDEQWEAITRGLSREVAVYQAARDCGFDAVMTSRVHDALGIDMQIRDPETQRYINIDCKTPPAFRHRLEDLLKEKRITVKELYAADERGYHIQHNGHGEHRVEVVLLCILQERLSEIIDYRFVDIAPIRDVFNQLIREHGIRDNRYGKDII